MIYRAEIDGLRALAVLPVVLFHAGLGIFEGGYVGVDIFFVISGYLITSILIGDLEKGHFSITEFYERRARRILPALFFVILCCIPFAYIWMLPSELVDFSRALVAVTLFASNILFWLTTNYFSENSEENPLLHTWSLAVEEQFYFFFPIFLLMVWRLGFKAVLGLLIILAAGSLLLSELGWRNFAVFNFYMAPTRVWELLIGSTAAVLINRYGIQKNSIAAYCGLATIIASIVIFDETTPFPSFYAVLPCLGTLLIIIYGHETTGVARFLSCRLFVGMGLISYSTYLWHQPIFAFARLRSLEYPSIYWMLALAVLSIILGWFSWRFVETPFRNRKKITGKFIFQFSLLGSFFIFLIGVAGVALDGFPGRLEQTEHPFYDSLADGEDSCFGRAGAFCNIHDSRPKIIVIGDSTIHPLASSLSNMQTDYAVVPITAGGCVLIDGYSLYDDTKSSFQSNCLASRSEKIQRYIEHEQPALIIVGGMFTKVLTGFWNNNGQQEPWKKHFRHEDGEPRLMVEEISRTILRLGQSSKNVVLLEFPELGFNAQKKTLKRSLFGMPTEELTVPRERIRTYHLPGSTLLRSVARQTNIHFLDTLNRLCTEEVCYPIVNGNMMFTDHIHPSMYYSDDIASEILNDFLPTVL